VSKSSWPAIGNFFVGAAGTVLLTYQWRHDGVDIPGANVSSLNVGNRNRRPGSIHSRGGVVGLRSSITSSPANLTLLATASQSAGAVGFQRNEYVLGQRAGASHR